MQLNLFDADGLFGVLPKGFGEISWMLVGAGARIDLPDQTGRTAVDYAREAGQTQILKNLGG